MTSLARSFALPAALALVAAATVLIFGGPEAFLAVALLALLETGLSFDNAVVNAQVLKRMPPVWQRRFLTWGIAVAVVGTRLILPILVVSAAGWVSPVSVALLAFSDGEAYGLLVEGARIGIAAFGGAFLLMLSLRYFFNVEKSVHWLSAIERRLARLGSIESIEAIVTAFAVIAAAFFAPPGAHETVLIAGALGIALSIAVERAVSFFSKGLAMPAHAGQAGAAASHGLALFVYLEILDTAFSLDGVVGAFALTTSVVLIVIGLGIGAYFVRTLTIYLTEHRILDSLIFVEHGAYWAIFGLAVSMFVGLALPVPEYVTGSVGFCFMFAAYLSSRRAGRLL